MTDKSFQPTLAGLRAFVAVAEKHHFGSAATTLGVTQSTLSQALAALETGLGTRLVERSTRRVRVTTRERNSCRWPKAWSPPPIRSAPRQPGRPIHCMAPAPGPDTHRGALRTADRARRTGDRLPELTLRVIEDQTERLLAALRDGAVDAALIALPADAAGITAIPIYDEDFVLALPPGHPLSGKQRVPAAALAELPLLLLDEGHCLRDQALDVCQKAGVRAELADTRAASLATAVQCVAGGLGATLIPQSAAPVEAARSRLGLARVRGSPPGSADRPDVSLVEWSRRILSAARRRSSAELISAEQKVRLVKCSWTR